MRKTADFDRAARFRRAAVTALSALALALAACTDLSDFDDGAAASSDGTATVSFRTGGDAARTILPAVGDLSGADYTYTVTGTMSGGSSAAISCEYAAYSDLTAASVGAAAGDWEFTLTAYSGGEAVLRGVTAVTVSPGKNNIVRFTLGGVSGSGSVRVTVSFPEEAKTVKAALFASAEEAFADGAEESAETLEISSGSAVFSRDGVAGGVWYLDFFLYDGGGSLAAAYTETVSVFNGLVSGADVTVSDFQVRISTAQELAKLASEVNAGDTKSGRRYILCGDIDLSSFGAWTPIGTSSCAFAGTFDGAGHTVSGISVDSADSYVGLFGNNGGTIKNLTVSGSVVTTGGKAGGVAGYNSGTVEDCRNEGAVTGSSDYVGGVVGYNDGGTVEGCENSGDVAGTSGVGGVVGCNYSSINGIAPASTVTGCRNTGAVTGSSKYVGGVVGYNYSYSNGSACKSASTVADCENAGAVTGDSAVGGVVGYNYSYSSECNGYFTTSAVENCSNTGAVTGSSMVGGVVGDNYSSMYNSTSTTTASTVADCRNEGDVTGTSGVGGVVGYNNGTVTGCHNDGTVTGSSGHVGGVVGQNGNGGDSTVTGCENTGAVTGSFYVGGVAGWNYNGTVTDCSNTGDVTGTGVTGNSYVGGVVGENDLGTVTGCENAGAVTGVGDYVGGVVGCNSYGTVTGCSSTGVVSVVN